MPQEPQGPQELAANEWGTISYHPQWNTIELKWSPKTESMTDDGFNKTLQVLANQGIKVRPRFMIIDATEFFYRPGPEAMAWRDEHIIPLYNESGLEKFALLAATGTPGTVEQGAEPAAEPGAAFATAWFESKDRMYAWLTS